MIWRRLASSRFALWAILGVITCLVSVAVGRSSFILGLDQLQQRGRADLALAADRLSAQLQRYQELSVLLASHPQIENRSLGASQSVRSVLLRAADKTAALNIMLMTPKGRILDAAFAITDLPKSAQPSVARAGQGALGKGFGTDYGDNQRAYYFVAPVILPERGVVALLAIFVDIDRLEGDWRGDRPAIYFLDDQSWVFISNRSELLGARLHSAAGDLPYDNHVANGVDYWRLDWGPYVPKSALPVFKDLPTIGLRAGALIDVAPVRVLALWQAGFAGVLAAMFSVLVIWAVERRRHLAILNAQLEARVRDRTQDLQTANAQLKKAQADLVQAGKLSALGQLSAGLSHELNQPLMAIEQFAQNAQTFLHKGQADAADGNLKRISDLALRMGRIIKNLRAFARNEAEPSSKVDLLRIIDQALDLTQPRLTRDGVTVDYTPPPDAVYVRGGEVRLAQVMVNLFSNAADAMQDMPMKSLGIAVETSTGTATITVQDTGPGIKDPDRIFDPFYSTKDAMPDQAGSVTHDPGMGLGLSISYGLVQSFGGKIRGFNTQTGAAFTVELPLWPIPPSAQ